MQSANVQTKPRMNSRLKTLIKIALMGAVAGLVHSLLRFPLPFFPSFYEFDFSETVVLIGSFALGPIASIIIEAIKVIINFLFDGTITAGIGELANFIMGCALVLPAAIIYKNNRTFKGAVIGIIVGFVVHAGVAALMNYYMLIPAYSKVMGLDRVLASAAKVNGGIVDLKSLILFATVPFNMLKGGVCALLTLPLYKRVSPLLKK